MAYLKINNHDYSMHVNLLKVATQHNYKQMTTASGRTIVKYINSKRTIEVGIIPLDGQTMKELLRDVNDFQVSVSFINPDTNLIEENVACIIPNTIVEYYTIQEDGTKLKAFIFTINEL